MGIVQCTMSTGITALMSVFDISQAKFLDNQSFLDNTSMLPVGALLWFPGMLLNINLLGNREVL